jgi:hypothetical protein
MQIVLQNGHLFCSLSIRQIDIDLGYGKPDDFVLNQAAVS